jgi:hypothetical protein
MVELSQLLTDERMLLEKRPWDSGRKGGNVLSFVGLGIGNDDNLYDFMTFMTHIYIYT